MIVDKNTQLMTSIAAIRAAATYVSDSLDLGVARNIGVGEELFVEWNVEVAFAGGTSVQAQLITSVNSDLSSPTVISSGPVDLEAALVVGFREKLPIPTTQLMGSGKRYFGIQFIGVGTHTAGTVSARIMNDSVDTANYASGFTVK